jgi:vesicle coat complex subunit
VLRGLLAVASALHQMKMKILALRILVKIGVHQADQVQMTFFLSSYSLFVNMLTKGEKED